MNYKFLLFDLDHTLLDFEAAEDVALTQLLEEAQVPDVQTYKDFYIPMNQQLWQDLTLNKSAKKNWSTHVLPILVRKWMVVPLRIVIRIF